MPRGASRQLLRAHGRISGAIASPLARRATTASTHKKLKRRHQFTRRVGSLWRRGGRSRPFTYPCVGLWQPRAGVRPQGLPASTKNREQVLTRRFEHSARSTPMGRDHGHRNRTMTSYELELADRECAKGRACGRASPPPCTRQDYRLLRRNVQLSRVRSVRVETDVTSNHGRPRQGSADCRNEVAPRLHVPS